MMLDGGTNKPNRALRLGHETVTTIDGDLAVAVNVVVGEPNPGTRHANMTSTRGHASEAANIPQSTRKKQESSECRGNP